MATTATATAIERGATGQAPVTEWRRSLAADAQAITIARSGRPAAARRWMRCIVMAWGSDGDGDGAAYDDGDGAAYDGDGAAYAYDDDDDGDGDGDGG